METSQFIQSAKRQSGSGRDSNAGPLAFVVDATIIAKGVTLSENHTTRPLELLMVVKNLIYILFFFCLTSEGSNTHSRFILSQDTGYIPQHHQHGKLEIDQCLLPQ